MRITVDMLDAHRACEEQVELFVAMWGRSVMVSLQTTTEAMALGLDIEWAAKCLLSATAREFYDKAKAMAWETYNKAMAPAWEVYEKATALAFVDACKAMDAKRRS